MEKFNIQQLLNALDNKPLSKDIFCTATNLKAQVMKLKAGNSIPPCKMENDVLFYFMSGNGFITVNGETQLISAGDCVLVPFQAESRSISSEIDLEILAVQGFK